VLLRAIIPVALMKIISIETKKAPNEPILIKIARSFLLHTRTATMNNTKAV
jgi:hypothetical protein